jgi:hypothetical protein
MSDETEENIEDQTKKTDKNDLKPTETDKFVDPVNVVIGMIDVIKNIIR